VELAPCLGLCELAPAALVNEIQIGHADPSRIYEAGYPQSVRPRNIVGGDIRLLTANCGKGRTTTLQEYESAGGYRALRRILGNNGMLPMSPQDVVQEIKNAGLIGRGGAAFPTGLKWEGAATATDFPKYVVCNGDEAEPGTFKDRVMMEEDPHRVLEGLIIAGYAIGANHGYIFIRGEYPHALEMMKRAIEEGHRAGLLGENILGSSFTFDVELRRGAGAYICGEETALFEAIEGKRGFPRSKPPYPTTYGLFGKPTVINNVETLANVPLILQMGSEAYRKIGTQKSPGPKLFCVSGDVRRPGLYEVPFGVPLRHLIEDLAGGIREGHQLQAMLIGGAAGTFAGPQHLDVSTSFEDLRAAGLAMGSGVITVFDETRDLRNVLIRLARFFAEESCGKCFPCQLGTQRQYEIIERLADGKPLPGDIERLNDVGWTMTDASLCGLGQTAASAVLSALKLFPELFTFGKE
jgi:NADH-quinone oxidoreductase subunit F